LPVYKPLGGNRNSMHGLGVACGLAAGVWLGGAEAPTKLVSVGFSPFAISLCMVMGVFVARWTVPTLFKGTNFIFADIFEKRHLILWAILAGALWAVANTLTVFAIRNVGLAIAFPLWNTNSLVGLFWGWLLFHELRGGGTRNCARSWAAQSPSRLQPSCWALRPCMDRTRPTTGPSPAWSPRSVPA
jgi:drug/metabolite transporter (DMT)-like permease